MVITDSNLANFGIEFFEANPWMDPSMDIATPQMLMDYAIQHNLLQHLPVFAEWTSTIHPLNPADRLYWTAPGKDGSEYVALSRAKKSPFQLRCLTQLKVCQICHQLINTPLHIFVYAFLWEEAPSRPKIESWKLPRGVCCYHHFQTEGKLVEGRNPFNLANKN